jgi:ABC-type dipeptide/oligopeptide/nickel transport system permease subunit
MSTEGGGVKRGYWRTLHWFLIMSLLAEGLYGFYMVFFVIGGSKWPLLARALDTPVEVILKRRLYAIEAWVALGALTVYLAITEILPKRLEDRKPEVKE